MKNAMNQVSSFPRSRVVPLQCPAGDGAAPHISTLPRADLLCNSPHQGFRNVAGYIFGGNEKKESIKMTAPVRAEPVKRRARGSVPHGCVLCTSFPRGHGRASPLQRSACLSCLAVHHALVILHFSLSEKIAMTAPVRAEPTGSSYKGAAPPRTHQVAALPQQSAPCDSLTRLCPPSFFPVSFYMPSKYSLETLPLPKDARVTLKEVPEHVVAAITFRCANRNPSPGSSRIHPTAEFAPLFGRCGVPARLRRPACAAFVFACPL